MLGIVKGPKYDSSSSLEMDSNGLDRIKFTKDKEYLHLSWMKTLFRLVTRISVYGSVLNQLRVLSL